MLVLLQRVICLLCGVVITIIIYRQSLPVLSVAENDKRVLSASENIFKAIPLRKTDAVAPAITAQSAIVFEPENNIIIFSKNADYEMPIASTTKIMTALIALENFSLTDTITVTNANLSIGSKAEIQPGEVWSVESLLYALMLPSGNDAAVAIAESFPTGYGGFVAKMNEKAQQLNLTHSHFNNVSGIDQAGHYSTAHDLALLTQHALTFNTFATIVKTNKFTIQTIDSRVVKPLINLNELLTSVPGTLGVKTGKSEGAGECLITYVKRDNHPIITVMLGSMSRFTESTALIEWVYQTYEWQTGVNVN